jgi:hypothetical protein
LKYKSCSFATNFVDLLFSLGLIQVITKPTRCTDHSATLIDHVITNANASNINLYIFILHISDHFPVITKISDVSKHAHPKFVEYRNFSEANVRNFTNAILALNWDHVLNNADAQQAYNLFSDSFFNLFNLIFPILRTKLNRNVHGLEKWMSSGILISRRNKLNLGKIFANNPSPHSCNLFKNYRNVYNRTVGAAKKLYYAKQFASNQSNLKKKHGS